MNLRASLNKIQKTEFQSSSRIEEIEGYIYNELSEEEMASFEAELSSNKTLSDEIELIRNIDLALKESEVIQLRNNLQSIAAKITSEKQTELSFISRFKARKVILSSVAASLILLLGITGLLTRHASQDKLYQKFYATYPISGINRSANESADQTLANGLQKYNNQDYKTSINLFREVTSRNQNNPVAHFYTAAALQETGEYQNAIDEYQMVVVNKDNLLVEQAQWYIGLCYLQTNENKKAHKQFKKIAENQGFYQPKAQAILRKISYSED
jgi:tetratricopeptide (TPR) repeat protein